MNDNVILRLLNSRKAVIMLLALVAAALLTVSRYITGHEALEFCKWMVITWLGSQAVVDACTRKRTCDSRPEPAQPSEPVEQPPASEPTNNAASADPK
jgi:hypothetical protein